LDTIDHELMTAEDFTTKVDITNGTAEVQTIKSVGPFVRKRLDVKLDVKDGVICPDVKQNVALASVIERYGVNQNHAHGFISGWSFNRGAIATTMSPDDNNQVVAGVDPDDMTLATNTLIECGGGQVEIGRASCRGEG